MTHNVIAHTTVVAASSSTVNAEKSSNIPSHWTMVGGTNTHSALIYWWEMAQHRMRANIVDVFWKFHNELALQTVEFQFFGRNCMAWFTFLNHVAMFFAMLGGEDSNGKCNRFEGTMSMKTSHDACRIASCWVTKCMPAVKFRHNFGCQDDVRWWQSRATWPFGKALHTCQSTLLSHSVMVTYRSRVILHLMYVGEWCLKPPVAKSRIILYH